MTKYISEPKTFTTGSEVIEGTVAPLAGDYAARGPYGSVVYGEGWRESDFPRGFDARIRADSHEYGVMEVSWHLPVENDNWDRFAVTRSTAGSPAAIEEGRVIVDLPRASGMENTLDEVPTSTSVAYSLFVRREDKVWVRVARTGETPVVQDRGMLETLVQAIPNHNFPNHDLERFLDVFAFELSKEHTALDAVLDKHNAFATPQPYVEALLAQYGFGSVVGLGGRRSRNFLEALYIQRRHRGTGRSLGTIAAALAGGDARVGTGVNLMHDRNHSRFAHTLGSWVGRGVTPAWSDPALADPYPPRVDDLGYLKVDGAGTVEGLSLPGTSGHYASTPAAGNGEPAGLRLPGTVGNYATSPDHIDLHLTGDIDLRCRGRLDWSNTVGSSTEYLVNKGTGGPSGQNYGLLLAGTRLRFLTSDGVSVSYVTSTVDTPLDAFELAEVRCTYLADSGSGDHEVAFFYRDGSTDAWVQIGTTVVMPGARSILNSTVVLALGGPQGGSSSTVTGTIYRAQVLDGIDGTAVFDVDFTDAAQGWAPGDSDTDTGTDATGKTVTIHGTDSKVLSPLDITGDIDIRVFGVRMSDFATGSVQTLVAKYGTSGNQRGYWFRIGTGGSIDLVWSIDGSSTTTSVSTVTVTAAGVVPGDRVAFRTTLQVNDGTGWRNKFFFSTDEGETWTQIGSDRSASGSTTINSNTATLGVGARTGLEGDFLAGTIERAQVFDGIDGDPVFDVDFTDTGQGWTVGDSGGDTGIEATGATVTIHGAGSEILGIPGDLMVMSGDSRLDAIPIDPGQHYSLSGYVRGDPRMVRMVIEWLDVEGNVLPTVTGTGVGPGPFGQYLIGAGMDGRDGTEGGLPVYTDHIAGDSWERITVRQAAPVEAVFARPGLLVENGQVGETFGLSDVQFEARYVPTEFEEPRLVLVDLLPHRTNYIRNCSMERGVYLWTAENARLVRSPRTWIGSYAGRMVIESGGPASVWTNTILSGSHAAWSIHLQLDPGTHGPTESRRIRLQIEWLDENDDVIATEDSDDTFAIAPGRWIRPAMIGSDTVGAAGSRCRVIVEDGLEGDALLFDAAVMEESTVVRQYFDGGLADSSYYWAGEPYLSESHFLASKDAILNRSAVELLRWLPGDRQVAVDAPPLVLRSGGAALIDEAAAYWVADDYDEFTSSYVDQSGNGTALSEPGGGETPRRFVYDGDSYVWFPGKDDDYAQHERSLDLEGITDATITVDIAPEVLGVLQDIYGQWDATGTAAEQNFLLSLTAANAVQLKVSDGDAVVTYVSTLPITTVAGQRTEIRAELVSGDVAFYETVAGIEAQIGTTVTGTFAGFASTSARQRVSGMYLGGGAPFTGKVYKAEFSAVDTVGLFEVEFIDQEGGQDWFIDRSTNGLAAIVVDEDFGTVALFDETSFLFANHDDVFNVGDEGMTTLFVGRVHEEYDDATLMAKKDTVHDNASGWMMNTDEDERVNTTLVAGTPRENLVGNPTVDTDMTGWSAADDSAVVRTTDAAQSGTHSLKVTPAASAGPTFTRASTAYLDGVAATAGVPRYPKGRNLVGYRHTSPSENPGGPNGWGYYAGSGGAGTLSRVDGEGALGGDAVRFTWTTAPTSGSGGPYIDGKRDVGTPDRIGAIPGATLSFSAYVRRSSPGSVSFFAYFYTSSGSTISAANIGSFTGSTEWQRHEESVIVPADADTILFAIYGLGPQVGDYIDVSHIQIEEGDTATPWRPGGPNAILIEEGTTNLLPATTAGWTPFAATVDQQADRLIVTGAAPPAPTFTRASTASLDGADVATGVPRYSLGRNLVLLEHSEGTALFGGYQGNTTAIASTEQAWSGPSSWKMTAVADGDLSQRTNPVTGAGYNGSVNNVHIVEPGETYTASAHYRAMTIARSCRVQIVWRDALGGFLGAVASNLISDSTTGWTRVVGSGVAPAAARYAFLAFSAIGCVAGESHYLDGVQLEQGSTATEWRPGGPSAVLIEEGTANLMPLGVSEGTSGWTNLGNAIVTLADTAQSYTGGSSVSWAASAAGNTSIYSDYPPADIVAGTTYTISVWVRAAVARDMYVRLQWDERAVTSVGNVEGPTIAVPANTWTRLTVTGTAPTGATACRIIPIAKTAAAGDTFYADAAQLEQKPYATSWHPGGSTRSGEYLRFSHGLTATSGTVEIDAYISSATIGRWNAGLDARVLILLRSNLSGSMITIYKQGTNLIYYFIDENGVALTSIAEPISAVTEGRHRFAMTWDGPVVAGWRDGTLIGQATLAAPVFAPHPTEFYAGSGVNGATPSNAAVDTVRCSARARTNTELADWTTPLEADEDTTYLMNFEGALDAEARVATVHNAADSGAPKAVSAGNDDPDRRALLLSGATVDKVGPWGDEVFTDTGAHTRAGFQLRGLAPGDTRTILRPQAEAKPYATSWHPNGSTRAFDTYRGPGSVFSPDKWTVEVDVDLSVPVIAGQLRTLLRFDVTDGDRRVLHLYWRSGIQVVGNLSLVGGVTESVIANDAALLASEHGHHRIGATYDGSTLRLYVDGVLRDEAPITLALHTSGLFQIGENGAERANAAFDTVRVSSVARSDAELADWTVPLEADEDTTWFQDFEGNLDYYTTIDIGAEYGTMNVTEGEDYTGSVHMRSDAERSVRAVIEWRDASDAVIETTLGDPIQAEAGGWVRPFVTGTAPVDATTAVLRGQVTGGWASTEVHYLDDALFETGDLLRRYFDGTNTWDGVIDTLQTPVVEPASDLILVMRVTAGELHLSRNIEDHLTDRTVTDTTNTTPVVIGARDTFGLKAARMEWKAAGIWDRVLTDDEVTLLSAPYLP